MTDPAFPTFELNTMGLRAKAQVLGGQFVVLAGSELRRDVTPSIANHSYAGLRPGLMERGEIAQDAEGKWSFARNAAFDSPSAAAAAILGRASNGRREWKVEGTETLYGEWADAHPSLPRPLNREADLLEPDWQPFFRELAAKLLDYEERQPELVQVLTEVGISINHDEGEPLSVVDPFTFFSLVLKHSLDTTALTFFAKIGARLGVQGPVPSNLTGVPWSMPMSAWFFSYRSKRQPGDVPTLWQLARQAVSGVLEEQTSLISDPAGREGRTCQAG